MTENTYLNFNNKCIISFFFMVFTMRFPNNKNNFLGIHFKENKYNILYAFVTIVFTTLFYVKTISFYRIKTAYNLFSEITLSSVNGLETFYLNPVV